MSTKAVTIGEFSANAHMLVADVVGGDVVRVDCDEVGAFVMLDEAEYYRLREALDAKGEKG